MSTANIVIIRVILFLINILFYCNDRHIYRNFTGTHRESHISLKKKRITYTNFRTNKYKNRKTCIFIHAIRSILNT